MDITELRRDANYVLSTLEEVGDTLVTRTGCKIHIPVHYEESNLITIGVETYILGIYAMIVEDRVYSVNSVLAMMRIDPTYVGNVVIDETHYYEFYFEPGSAVIRGLDLVQNDVIAYYVYDEFMAKGRVPWYIDYYDKGRLFASAPKHAGIRIGANQAVMEMMVATNTRNPNNLSEYYRQYVNATDKPEPAANIPSNSVIYGATNTTAKLNGSYFDLGVVSALNNPSVRKERIEDILRQS